MVIDSVLEVRGIIFVYTIIVMRNVLEGQQMVTAELTAYLSTHRDGYGAASPARSHQGAWIFPNVGYFFLALSGPRICPICPTLTSTRTFTPSWRSSGAGY